MLALTPIAAEAIQNILKRPNTPDGAVLRITTEASSDDGKEPSRDLRLGLADHPSENDLTFDEVGVAVEPEAAEFLDDKVLDAELGDGEVRFNLYPQPDRSGQPEPNS